MNKNSNQITSIPKKEFSRTNNSIKGKTNHGSLRPFSKLLIGSIAIGLDELSSRLNSWEKKSHPEPIISSAGILDSQKDTSKPNSEVIPYEIIEGDFPQYESRYVLIGLLNVSEDRLVSAVKKAGRIGGIIKRITYPIVKPLNRNWLIPPLQRRYAALIERGETELNNMVLVGRSEYDKSRRMAQIAYEDSFEEAVDSLSTNPEIQDLIQSQGMGLAEEVINEVRERSLSADNFVDSFVRSILRRKPRSIIPPPQFLVK